MKFIKEKIIGFDFNRFILAGIFNSAITYLIYIIGLLFLNYLASYTMSYISGIIISYYLNTLLVFEVNRGWKSFFYFTLGYLMQYLFSLVLLVIIVDLFHLNKIIAPLLAISIIIPISYFVNKRILRTSYGYK